MNRKQVWEGGGRRKQGRVESSVNKSECKRKVINNVLLIFGATVVHTVCEFFLQSYFHRLPSWNLVPATGWTLMKSKWFDSWFPIP